MKNKESTSSILDNIRKKMQKIEDKKVSENIELGDEFEYIDKATKQDDVKKVASEIINDSKAQTAVLDDKDKTPEFVNDSSEADKILEAAADNDGADGKLVEKDNFLYDNELEDHSLNSLTSSDHDVVDDHLSKPASEAVEPDGLDDLNLELEGDSDHSDDLDLEELSDLEEDHHEDDLDVLDDEKGSDSFITAKPTKPVEQQASVDQKDHLEEELLAEEEDYDEEHHDDVLNLDEHDELDEYDVLSDSEKLSNPVVDSVYEATANEIISEIKSTDNQQNNMISDKVAKEATNSINKLIEQTTPKKQPEPAYVAPKVAGSKTVEDLAMEILQPKLEEWLNTNLTSIVERVVSEEIKKIIPKK